MYRKIFRGFWVLFFLSCQLVHGATTTNSSARSFRDGIWSHNDAVLIDEKTYKFNLTDPYLVSPELSFLLDEIEGLYFELDTDGQNDMLEIQLFWSTKWIDFTEEKSFTFRSRIKNGRVQFYIPKEFFFTRDIVKQLRIDFILEESQEIQIIEADVIRTESPYLNGLVPHNFNSIEQDYKKIDFGKTQENFLVLNPVGSDVRELGPLEMTDIEIIQGKRIRVLSGDPFIETAPLKYPVDEVAGLFLKLTNAENVVHCRAQVFWQTYLANFDLIRFDYSESRSYKLWINFIDGQAQIFVPFNVLPEHDLIRRLRIDFDECSEGMFDIENISMVALKNRAEFDAFRPHQIIYRLATNVSYSDDFKFLLKNHLIQESNEGASDSIVACIVRKLTYDTLFWVIYLLLLIGGIVSCVVTGKRKS